EGMLCGVEYVEDKAGRVLFDAAKKIGPQIVATLMAEERVIARAMPQGDILGFAPPLCLSRAEADKVVKATERAVRKVLG
ncbi:MAG: aspartate aminotransferase family protein, partial [Paracoccaceae bacterium]|nr:aspartate aminotransferase family protein [Paracoccaceae bacterium]